MGRSIKKGPFVAYHLLKKVEVLNEKELQKLLKHGRGRLLLCRL